MTTHDARPDRRMLLVHAHPDDETIATGATMAKYAAAGDGVTLVTCTLGEEGEILVPELAHLASSDQDRLGEHRIEERATAMAALGVSDYRWLGGAGRWRDSGMMGEPTNDNPACFWRADLDEAIGELVRVIREVQPQVVITYDDNGGYGHPDHIQTHRVTVGAFDAAGDASRYPDAGKPWAPTKLYETMLPKSLLVMAFEVLKEMGEDAPFGVTEPDELGIGADDELITTQIDARGFLDNKMAALRAYPTQVAVDGHFFALSNDIGQGAFALEHYRLVRGPEIPGPGWESDLFTGVA
jgi:N-acetyl-1-D-myo-inositol-2-amino-2-deoxy-alpha-D-glucopyranoside deacetylase